MPRRSYKPRLWNRTPSFALALLLGLAACNDPAPDPAQQASFTDDLGRTITYHTPVRRVVTLAPNLTELVYAAGAGGLMAGVSTADTYPPAIDTLPRYSVFPINYEAITARSPDLILATDHVNGPRDAEAFAALGIPTAFFTFRTLDDVLRGLRRIGTLLGTAPTADAAADSLQHALQALEARTAAVATRPQVLFLVGDETLFAFGKESYVHEMIHLAGGRSATAGFETEAPVLSDEFVLTTLPEVIMGGFGPDYDPRRLLDLHPTWDVIPALREGRVYSLDPDLIYRPGPRLIEGIRQMALALHPSLFEEAHP